MNVMWRGALVVGLPAVDASTSRVPAWNQFASEDDAACLLAVQASKSRTSVPQDYWNDDDSLCQLAALNIVSDSASFGEVAATLLADCQSSDWSYSASLCEEVISELFKDNDAEASFSSDNCDQVRGLVAEHWQHQVSVPALLQRAQHMNSASILEVTAKPKVCDTKDAYKYPEKCE